MLGRERHRLAKAEGEGVIIAGLSSLALEFVGDGNDRLSGTAQNIGKSLVGRIEAGARINQEKADVGLGNGDLGLLAHARFERSTRRLFQAGGIDYLEIQTANMGVSQSAVTRDARCVIDQRQTLADKLVE